MFVNALVNAYTSCGGADGFGGSVYGFIFIQLKLFNYVPNMNMNMNITEEERILLQSRLERACGHWPLVAITPQKCVSINHNWFNVSGHTSKIKPNPPEHGDLLLKYNFIYAGGYVTDRLRRTNTAPDVDIFVIGSENASERVWGFLHDLTARVAHPYSIMHAEHTITVAFDSQAYPHLANKFQIILRVYPSIGHVLHGFDISAAMVAWNGEEFLTTRLGLWTLVHNAIPIDATRSSPSFKARLQKYHLRKGFGLIFVGVPCGVYEQHLEKFNSAIIDINNTYALAIQTKQLEFRLEAIKRAQMAVFELCRETRFEGTANADVTITYPHTKSISNHDQIRTVLRAYNVRYEPDKRYTGPWFPRLKVGPFKFGQRMPNRWRPANETMVMCERRQRATSDYEPDRRYRAQYVSHAQANAKFALSRPEFVYSYAKSVSINHPADILSIPPEAPPGTIMPSRAELHWITENPGRQWTSSFNPEPITGYTFYGSIYVGRINQAHIIRQLWLARRDPNCVWYTVPRDIMRMLTMYVLRAIATP